MLSGLAQGMMYVAIIAPLFWAPRIISRESLLRLVVIVWAFHVTSSLFGVLQTHFPGRFQPSLSSNLEGRESAYMITLANGEQTFRPMGLLDSPGGAAASGFYSMLFGAGVLLTNRSFFIRLFAIGGFFLGLYCLLLAHVRSMVVLALICQITIAGVFFMRGQLSRLALLACVLAIAIFTGAAWATTVGGEAVTNRLSTLVQDDPTTVYYENRGRFLEHTIVYLLPRYPFGAGLGRWGMMYNYFGSSSPSASKPIWVEIQWTGWLLDGGIPLVLAFVATIWVAILTSWRMAFLNGIGSLWVWAVILFAYNLGALAMCFNVPFFQSNGAMELWLLNGGLYGVVVLEYRRTRKRVSASREEMRAGRVQVSHGES